MSKVIYKYEINPGSLTSIPKGAILRHAEHQAGQLCMWAEVDPATTVYDQWTFIVAGTGHVIDSEWQYFNSWLDGSFVWHLFCRVEVTDVEQTDNPAAA